MFANKLITQSIFNGVLMLHKFLTNTMLVAGLFYGDMPFAEYANSRVCVRVAREAGNIACYQSYYIIICRICIFNAVSQFVSWH